jgi:hypothetical protein
MSTGSISSSASDTSYYYISDLETSLFVDTSSEDSGLHRPEPEAPDEE